MYLSNRGTQENVQVLLSTYNGSRYLESLISSVLDQDYPNIEIIIRDDGSTDDTMDILERYALKNKNISIIRGSNVGVPNSFFRLLQMVSPGADYFSFCDQDDVWQKDKLTRAINILKKIPNTIPAMYCGRVIIVDEHLNTIGLSPIPKRGPSFKNALVQNIATGCTIVINRAARDIIMKEIPKHALMHDWWIYLVVSAFGVVIYDPEPKIFYRQHSSNVVGIRKGFLNHWRARALRFLKHRRGRLLVSQAAEFNNIYGRELSQDKKHILCRFIEIETRNSLRGRIHYAFCGEIFRQTTVDTFILKLLILCGYI